MSVDGRFDEIGRAELLAVADRFQVPERFAVIDEVRAAVAAWPRFAAEAGVGSDDSARIGATFPTL